MNLFTTTKMIHKYIKQNTIVSNLPPVLTNPARGKWIFAFTGHNSETPPLVIRSRKMWTITPYATHSFSSHISPANSRLWVNPRCLNIFDTNGMFFPSILPPWSMSGSTEPNDSNIPVVRLSHKINEASSPPPKWVFPVILYFIPHYLHRRFSTFLHKVCTCPPFQPNRRNTVPSPDLHRSEWW